MARSLPAGLPGRILSAMAFTAAASLAWPAAAGAAPASAPTAPPPQTRHLANPYVGASVYANPEWGALAASVPGGAAVRRQPTALWMTAAAVDGREGKGRAWSLRQHLDHAVHRKASLVQIVIVDELARWCPRLVSTDLPAPWQGAVDSYRHALVDEVAALEKDPAYASLRFVNIVEARGVVGQINPFWSPFDYRSCAAVVDPTAYQESLAYALAQLHAVGRNAYQYLDAGRHDLFGWHDSLPAAATLLTSLVTKAGGPASVDGIAVNLAGYGALREPWIQPTVTINGSWVRQSKWLDWNEYADELTYARAMRAALVDRGLDAGLGIIVDTGRNGWGGPDRPSGPSTSAAIDTYVDASRIDRRQHYSDYCNQVGAGLGPRPRATPGRNIDAYVWARPPGMSDGPSENDGTSVQGFDPMCDPDWSPQRGALILTNALPDAPATDAWFPEFFAQLLANAYPPLP